MPSIFISYHHSDHDFAKWIMENLKECGAIVWLDRTHVSLGDSLFTKIADGITSVDFLVVILSRKATTSKWVIEETNLAIEKGIPIIPLVIEPCEPPGFLATRLMLDFGDAPERDKLLGELLSRVGLGLKPIAYHTIELLRLQQRMLIESKSHWGEAFVIALATAVLLGSIYFAVFKLLLFLFSLASSQKILPQTVAHLMAIGLWLTVMVCGYLLLAFLEKLCRRLEEIYIYIVRAPRCALIAYESNTDRELAVLVYESAFGTKGLCQFLRHLDCYYDSEPIRSVAWAREEIVRGIHFSISPFVIRHLLRIDGLAGIGFGLIVLLYFDWFASAYDLPESCVFCDALVCLLYGIYSSTLATMQKRPVSLVIGLSLAHVFRTSFWILFVFGVFGSATISTVLYGTFWSIFSGTLGLLEWRHRNRLAYIDLKIT